MKLLIAIAALLTLTAAYAFPNEPAGFRGIEWGSSLDAVKKEFVQISDDGKGRQLLARKADKLNIGSAELDQVTYIFYKGRFQGVMLRTVEGIGHQRALRDAFTAQFGRGNQPNRYMERFYWWGTTADVSLDCFNSQHRCIAMMRSRAISDIEQADKKAAAAEAKKDF